MKLIYERKIATNVAGYSYLNIPKAVADAMGTKKVFLKIKDEYIEVIPRRGKR